MVGLYAMTASITIDCIIGGYMQKTIWIKDIHTLATMDNNFTIHHNCDVITVDREIREIITGPENKRKLRVQEIFDELGISEANEQINASSMVVLPGFVNTHHHLYQVLTRVIPAVQDSKLFTWLTHLYEIWRGLDPEAVKISAMAGIGELMLTGCTTTTDHFYVFPEHTTPHLLDSEIEAADILGIRFHPCRGSMSRGKSQGGLPPDDVVQTEKDILKDSQRLIEKYHNNKKFSMLRIALAPCSPFSVTPELMRDTAVLAREKKVRLHTHLAETIDENTYCSDIYKKTPIELMEELNWLGKDVWFAHGIHFSDTDLDRLSKTGTGIAHCPVSNMRLGSGIARIPEMMKMGIPVGLAVDGSASNDSSNMLMELKQCLLLHRLKSVDAMTARQVFMAATRGGARLLGRNDIGQIKEGLAADIIMYNINSLAYAGAQEDFLSSLLFCGFDQRVDTSIINGNIVVRNKTLLNINEEIIGRKAVEVSRAMTERARSLGKTTASDVKTAGRY